MGELVELLGQLQEILTGVINGDNTMISSEGSLAGSDGAGDVGESWLVPPSAHWGSRI